MKKFILIILCIFLLNACTSKSKVNELDNSSNQDISIDNSDIFNEITKYYINEDIQKEIKNVIFSHPKVQYYFKVNNYTDMTINYKNKLEVYADNETIPFLTLWQEPSGDFDICYDFRLIYDFTYTKDNEERNASLYLRDFDDGFTGNEHPKYSRIKLIANNQEFGFYYDNSNLKEDYETPIIFTADLQNKILKYLEEYMTIDSNDNSSLLLSISSIIQEKGTPYTFTPFKMGECIDNRINEFDSITSLTSRNCVDGNSYNLTPYYLVEIGNLYGLVNEKHELVLPIVNHSIIVWDNNDLFVDNWEIPNETIYHINGGYGGAFREYMHDNNDVYIYSQGDDGPGGISKLEDFNSNHISIPVELIKVTNSTKNEFGDWFEYEVEPIGYGLMDGEGNVLTTKVYDEIANVLDDYVYVSNDGLFGYLDTNGEEIIPLMYENAMYVYNNQAIVMKDGKYGAITMDNNVIVDFKYDKLSYFGKDCYVGLHNNKLEIIYI